MGIFKKSSKKAPDLPDSKDNWKVCQEVDVNGKVIGEHMVYVEPEDYFPRELREKYHLGEFDDSESEESINEKKWISMVSSKSAYYIYNSSMYYVSFNTDGAVDTLCAWPNASDVSEIKVAIARKSIKPNLIHIAELVSVCDHDAFVISKKGHLFYRDRKDLDGYILLFHEMDHYYENLYEDEIAKYVNNDTIGTASSFWKLRAKKCPGISITGALDRLKEDYKDFIVLRLVD